MFIFFDTETTGKAKNFNAPMSDTNNWPRVTQLSFYVYDIHFKLLYQRTELVKPDGWIIPSVQYYLDMGLSQEKAEQESKFFVENGMLQENNEKHGIPMSDLLDDFLSQYDQCTYLVAHNMKFDFNVLGCEMIRYKKRAQTKILKICTMEESTEYVKATPHRYGKYKWPTLIELHTKLFGFGFDGAHDAGADVRACAKSLQRLLELKVIGLPVEINGRWERVDYNQLLTQAEQKRKEQLEREQTNIDFNNVENE